MKSGVAILVMLGVVPLLAQGSAGDRSLGPEPTSITGATPHIYKTVSVEARASGPSELRLHVFDSADKSTQPRPAIVCFFVNPGWYASIVETVVPHARHFASNGLVGIVAGTRDAARYRGGPLQAIADVRSAIPWTRAHARELGIDEHRIAALGISSGGHLALSAALLDGVDESGENLATSGRPDALVLVSPPVSTSFLTDRLWSLPEAMREQISPIKNLRGGLPPSLVLGGKASWSIPYSDLELFCSRSQAMGNRCDLVGYDTSSDGFFDAAADGGRWFQQSLTDVDRFLTSLDYLPQQ